MTMTEWKRQEQQAEERPASAETDAGMQSVRMYLREVRHAYLYSKVLCERAERYREMAARATGRVNALRVSGTPDHSKVEKYVLELVDVHKELQERISQQLKMARKAEKLIATLKDERYRMVLQLRYLCGCDWPEIAEKLHFTLRWVHKLHGDAILKLEENHPVVKTGH